MRQSHIPLFLLCILFTAMVSCKKPNNATPSASTKSNAAQLLSYGINGVSASVKIAEADHQVFVRFSDSLTDASNIIASFTLSKGATATYNGFAQVSGQTKNDYAANVYLEITAEDGITKKVYNIIAGNNNYSYAWGLGNIVQKAVSNNRQYEWYFGQANTGPYSTSNCGPASATMAIKWYDSTFTRTPAQARDSIPVAGDFWYGATIANYLRSCNVNYYALTLSDTIMAGITALKNQLNHGRILLVAINSSGLRYSAVDTAHVDRYYDWNSGHFIVVKGYRDVDYQTFFEVYDPWNYEFYNFGAAKGKDRFYRGDELVKSSSYNGSACWAIIPK